MTTTLEERLLIMAPNDRGSIVCAGRTTAEMNADIREAAARLTTLQAEVDRLRAESAQLAQGLVHLHDYAERTLATFKDRLGERKSPTWFAVNVLQDFVGFVRLWDLVGRARTTLKTGA